jgi:NTE family protein
MQDPRVSSSQPVQVVETGSDHDDLHSPEPGIALSLSGGGYRAMLFHIGSLWRLNELGYLQGLKRISSVSGGSITAGMLGLKWGRLGFGSNNVAANYVPEVVAPIRALASRTIDRTSILSGLFTPGSISTKIADAYREHLFGKATLQDLPDDAAGPRFVINATSVQTGALFRFSRPYIADYRVGRVLNPTIELALAVTVSSAFPPVLSPCTIEFDPKTWVASGSEDLHLPPYLSRAVLSDGGVYDNLGLETTWKRYDTILVSNGGGKMAAEESPHADWARHAIRINEIIDNQVRSLRARQVIDSFKTGIRKGTYWGIRTDIAAYDVTGALPCPVGQTTALAETATRLKELPAVTQERLINWGYAVCDAGMRKHVATAAAPPAAFPYPGSAVG